MGSQNRPRHQSAVTREDFSFGLSAVCFGRGHDLPFGLLTVVGRTDAGGFACANVGVSAWARVVSIGQRVANVIRLAIV